MTVMEKEMKALDIKQMPVEGVSVAEGAILTEQGMVRIPKSKLKRLAKELPKEPDKEPERAPEKSIPVQSKSIPKEDACKVVFETKLGDVTGLYYPIIDAGDFIVLGLTDQSFIPKTYTEDRDLRFRMRAKKVDSEAIFTGCRFTEPDIRREYIVMMKVKS